VPKQNYLPTPIFALLAAQGFRLTWCVINFVYLLIMLTGQADEKAIARAREEANLSACLYKPWTEEELFKIINSALSYSGDRS
jgi:AmiR/NasT family two-component response regulator